MLSPYPASSHPPRNALHVQVLQPHCQIQSSKLSLWKAKSPHAPHRALLFQPGRRRGQWEIEGKWAKHWMKWSIGSSWDRVVWSIAPGTGWCGALHIRMRSWKRYLEGRREWQCAFEGNLDGLPQRKLQPMTRSWVPWSIYQKFPQNSLLLFPLNLIYLY